MSVTSTFLLAAVQFLLLLGASTVFGFDRNFVVRAFTQSESSEISTLPEVDDDGSKLLYRRKWHSKNGTKTAYDIIEELGATEFLELATNVKLDSIFKNPHGNVTIFVPTNEAMMTVAPNLRTNLSSMAMIIRYHIVRDLVELSDFSQNKMLDTLAKYGQDTAKYRLQVRTNIYKINNSKIFSANGAAMIKPDQKGNGTVVHLINKALYPLPLESAYYTIFRHSEFSILKTLLQKSFTLLRVLSDMDRFLTFFAPTNDAFKKLSKDDFTKFQNDVPLLTKVLVDHMATNTYYSVGIPASWTVKGVSHNKLLLQKKQNNYFVSTNNVTGQFTVPDMSVLNGVIHGIDTLLYNPNPNPKSGGVDIIG